MQERRLELKIAVAAIVAFVLLAICTLLYLRNPPPACFSISYHQATEKPKQDDLAKEALERIVGKVGKDVESDYDVKLGLKSASAFDQPKSILVAIQRKLIRIASIVLQVEDVPRVVQQVKRVAESLNGYVASLSQSQIDERRSASITIRVPSERYSEALIQLQALGRVVNLSERAQDVTEEFIDIDARLRNLKRSEEHLLTLLKRSAKVSELLSVEKELANRRSEIERLEGRLRYLSHQTALSTIDVTLLEFRPHPLPAGVFSVTKIIADAFRSVVTVARLLLAGVIWALMYSIFFGLPLIVIVWLAYRRARVARPHAGEE